MLIFGYGSLFNPEKVWRNGMRKHYTIDELTPAKLYGYRREWNASWKGRDLYLGLIKCPNSFCNGVIFELEQYDLSAWCKSEMIGRPDGNDNYILTEVSAHITYTEHSDSPIYTCVTRRPSNEGTIPPHYVPIIKEGLELWGKSFTLMYEQTTFPKPYSKE